MSVIYCDTCGRNLGDTGQPCDTCNPVPAEHNVIPAQSRIRLGRSSYRTVADVPVENLEPVKAQTNRHMAVVCEDPTCAAYQREHNGGKLLVARVTLRPSKRLWVPACGGCGRPMTFQVDTHNLSDVE
jgi:hypothetical protein